MLPCAFCALQTFMKEIVPEPIMVALQDTVQYAGQSIAIVLAATQAQADAAALLVTATYTNQLPPILTIADAVSNPSRGIFDYPLAPLVEGDVTAALSSAPFIIQV
jgi:xanthine dehydrogenase molybdopterin-binding subunit B